MIRFSRHGEVTAIHLSTLRSRLVRYGVYVFVTRGTLIDTGFPAVRTLVGVLLDERQPAGVVLTHQHEDHAGNAELVAARGIPIAASAATIAAIRDPAPIGFYRRFVWSSMPSLRTAVHSYDAPGLELIRTPGHSSDHCVVWDAERETLFSGDLFLAVRVRLARTDENPRALVESLRAAAALRPRLMLDSHRGVVERPVESLLLKAEWVEETIGRIDAGIAAGRPDRVIRDEVLGAEDAVAIVSGGELAKINFVRAVRGAAR